MNNPKVETLHKIADALGIPFIDLFSYTDIPFTDEVKTLAVEQYNQVMHKLLTHIVNKLAPLPFEKLNDINECMQFLSPDEIHGYLWNARSASMNGHTPEDVGEWLRHQDPKH